MNTHITKPTRFRRMLVCGLMAGLVGGSATAYAQGEDEWYDPTDWFDGNNIEADDTFDYSAYDYDYDYGFDGVYDYGTDWSGYHTWGTDVWEPYYYDAGYWDRYDWDDHIDYSSTSSTTSANRNSTADNSSSSQNRKSGKGSQQSNKSSQSMDNADKLVPTEIYTFTVFAVPTDSSHSASQQKSSARQSQSGSKNQQGPKQSGPSSVARLNGTVEGLQQMRLKQASGAMGTYTLANIRLENGKHTIVNLGRSSRLEDLQLEKGDSIQALGRQGQIDGKTVFVAHKLKSGGRTINANPVIRLSDRQMAQNQSQKTIKGTVADFSQSSSRADNSHTLLNVRLENGQSATVDLGPAVSLDQIDLQKGETVTIRGHTEQSGGRQVLVPDLMKVDGQKIASVSE